MQGSNLQPALNVSLFLRWWAVGRRGSEGGWPRPGAWQRPPPPAQTPPAPIPLINDLHGFPSVPPMGN